MKRSHFICLIAAIGVMFLGPAVGLMITTLRMRSVIGRLPPDRLVEPSADLASQLKATLPPTIVGVGLGALGLVAALAVVAAHIVRLRKSRDRTATLRRAPGRGS